MSRLHGQRKIKIVSCILLASFSFSIGCYNNETMTREQLSEETKARIAADSDRLDLTAFTDSLHYRFPKGSYRVQGDSLSGIGFRIIDGDERPFQGAISFAEVTLVQTEEFSLSKSVALPVVVLGAIFGVVMLLMASDPP